MNGDMQEGGVVLRVPTPPRPSRRRCTSYKSRVFSNAETWRDRLRVTVLVSSVGVVPRWEPPQRLVLARQITPDFQFDPELVTEIEVRFEAIGPNQTRVDLEHRDFDRLGARVAEMRAIFDSGGVPGAPQGWAGIFCEFAAAASPK
jgi:hypothetical protein